MHSIHIHMCILCGQDILSQAWLHIRTYQTISVNINHQILEDLLFKSILRHIHTYIASYQLAHIINLPLLSSVDSDKLAASPGPSLVKATTLN